MPTRKAEATWKGALKDGEGYMSVESGAYEGKFSFSSRFEDEPASNPEELLGAAHAGCFSMAFSNELDGEGFTPEEVTTEAAVHLGEDDTGPAITKIHLDCEATVPEIDDDTFQEIANGAKENCPVSKALAGVGEITLDATLE